MLKILWINRLLSSHIFYNHYFFLNYFRFVSMLESESRASFEIVVKIILWAKFNIVTSRIRPAGRQLPTPALHGELKLLVGEGSAGVTLMFVGFFYFVLVSNFLGLFPYVFTGTILLVITLTLGSPLWLSFMLFGWINYSVNMFSHLIPGI